MFRFLNRGSGLAGPKRAALGGGAGPKGSTGMPGMMRAAARGREPCSGGEQRPLPAPVAFTPIFTGVPGDPLSTVVWDSLQLLQGSQGTRCQLRKAPPQFLQGSPGTPVNSGGVPSNFYRRPPGTRCEQRWGSPQFCTGVPGERCKQRWGQVRGQGQESPGGPRKAQVESPGRPQESPGKPRKAPGKPG